MPREGKTSITVDDETYDTLAAIKAKRGTTWDKLLLRWAADEPAPPPEEYAEMLADRLAEVMSLKTGVDAEAIAQRVSANLGIDRAAVESAAKRGAESALEAVTR